MIYLIGGSPRSGKTILARKLSQKLSIQNISTDLLRLFMIASLNPADKYKYFPFEKIFDTAGSVESFYQSTTASEMLAADITEAENLMPGILAFIDHLQKTETDYIIEGVHFLPSLIPHLKTAPNIKILILTKTDGTLIHQGLKENKGQSDWIADNIHNDQTLANAVNSLAEYGKYFETESEKYQFHYINTEDHFLDKIEEAVKYLE